MNKNIYKISLILIGVVTIVFFIFTQKIFLRIDLTKEKRFSIAESSKNILKKIEGNIEVTLHLSGDLDANMTQLRYAVKNKVQDLNSYAGNNIILKEQDPNQADTDEKRYANYKNLERMGMKGMTVSNKNNKGGVSQSIVFPWLSISYFGDTIPVCLINPDNNLHPLQAVNAAIEDMEYLLMDAIRVISSSKITKIAFIEGHGELTEMGTYNISESLSRYFQVDRGVIGGQNGILDGYDAIIIANPTQRFSEADKYVIDQYIMNGGSVFWSIDGVMKSDSMLASSGLTPILPVDINLNDILFKYGVRISNTVIQDMQCTYIPVNVAMPNESPKFENIPWFYSPLLTTSPYHPITKNRAEVMANFASALEFPGESDEIKKEIVLISGNASRVNFAPSEINIQKMMEANPEEYFIHGYVPVAAVLEGNFKSVFENRMVPKDVYPTPKTISNSKATKMIVVADGSIMENKVETKKGGLWIAPLGYDRSTQRTYGNTDFVINSMLYLTDNDGLMELRNRVIPIRLLNSAMVQEKSGIMKLINTIIPLAILIIVFFTTTILRKRRYKNI